MHSLEASAFRGSPNALGYSNMMKSSEAPILSLDTKIERTDIPQQKSTDIFSISSLRRKHFKSSPERNSFLETIASALDYPSRHSRTLLANLLKRRKENFPSKETRIGSIENTSVGVSSFPKQKVDLFRNFPGRVLKSKQIYNWEIQYQQKDSSAAPGHRLPRHIVKRQSSLITEYCGHLGRDRCQSLQVGHCAHMCINGRRQRTVCRLRHPEREVVCIVRTHN
ncbi:hypothetical protein BsWGS_19126 [Bradybaena similaris]